MEELKEFRIKQKLRFGLFVGNKLVTGINNIA
jgi:hypothetical protein